MLLGPGRCQGVGALSSYVRGVEPTPTWSCCPTALFMDSLQLDPETVDNLDAYNHIPPQLMEKCAALASARPDTVRTSSSPTG